MDCMFGYINRHAAEPHIHCRKRKVQPARGHFAKAADGPRVPNPEERAKRQIARQRLEQGKKRRRGTAAEGIAQAAGAASADAAIRGAAAAPEVQLGVSSPEAVAPSATQLSDYLAAAEPAAAQDRSAPDVEVVSLLDSEPQTEDAPGGFGFMSTTAAANAHSSRVLVDSEPQDEEQGACGGELLPPGGQPQQRRALLQLSASDDDDILHTKSPAHQVQAVAARCTSSAGRQRESLPGIGSYGPACEHYM